MAIHINPKHKGLFHVDLGIPEGSAIPLSRVLSAKRGAKKSGNPAKEKRANFALMAKRHWKPLHKKD